MLAPSEGCEGEGPRPLSLAVDSSILPESSASNSLPLFTLFTVAIYIAFGLQPAICRKWNLSSLLGLMTLPENFLAGS